MTKKKDTTDWKSVAIELANKVNFALANLAPRGGGSGLVYNTKTGKTSHWRDGFADALEMLPGLQVDREASHALDLSKKERDKFFKKLRASN